MPRISLIDYFFSVMGAISLYFLFTDFSTGIIYVSFTGLSFFTCSLFKSKFYKAVYFIFTLCITLAYFIRPVILLQHPEMFMYQKISSQVDADTIHKCLWITLLEFSLISLGFLITVKAIPDKFKNESTESNYLIKKFNIINVIIIVIVFSKLAVTFLTNAGLKYAQDRQTDYSFILKLLSPDLIFYIYYLYISKYWKKLSLVRRLIVLGMIAVVSFDIFITGSKIFIALFALCFFFNFVYENKKFKITTALALSVLSIVGIVFSFAMAFAVKFSSTRDINGIIAQAKNYTSGDVWEVANSVTQRFMGLDGQIAVYIIQNHPTQYQNADNALHESFKPDIITLHALQNILPKVDLTSVPTTGSVISQYVVNYTGDYGHGGSLGLIASSYYAAENFSFLFDISVGFLLAIYFIYTRRIKNPDLRFILFCIGGYLIVQLVISANFDSILAYFVLEWILLFVYLKIVQIVK